MIRVLTFFLVLTSHCFAQQNLVDSLLKISVNQKGEEKVNTLINISRQYFINQDTLAIQFANEAVALAQSIGYDEGVGKAMLFLGLSWADLQPDSALRYYLKSSEILSRLDHSWSHFGYRNASDIYINKGWFPEALDCVLKVYELGVKVNDTTQMVEALSNMGYLHNRMENFEESIAWQRRALEALGNIENDTRRGLIYGRLGIVFDDKGLFDSAHYYNNLAVNFFQKAGNAVYLAQWKANIANTYIKQKNFQEAERLLMEAMQLNEYEDRKPNMLNNLAKVFIETGRYSLAGKALDSSYYFTRKFQMNDVMSELWYRRYELANALGRVSDALDYYIRYSTLRDSVLNEKKTGQIAQMLVRFETENKEKALLFEQAERARAQAEKVQAQLSASRTQKWIWGISLFTSLLVVLIPFIIIYYNRKVQNEKNLAIIEEQKKVLAAIINAQEEERKRVAKDLHDGVGQQISAVSLNFQALARKLVKDNPELANEIEKIKRMILDTSQEIRAVSHQMMPRALTQFGLVDALEDMIEMSFRDTGIEYEFYHRDMEVRLPNDIEIGLYRVAQELISNVIRHSKAQRVDIRLYKHDNNCILSVGDDGIGFDTFRSEGIGLTNITSRVHALQGNFRIESKPDNGTFAIVKVSFERGE